MTKKHTLSEWFMLFLKEWLFPTIGKSVGIATITAAIFDVPGDTPVPEGLEKNIYHLFDWTQTTYYSFLMVGSATLLLATFLAQRNSEKPDTFWSKLSRKRGLASLTANFLFGSILLPLVVAITALVKQGHSVATLIPLAVAYALMSALFHWLGKEGTHPFTGILYVVRPTTREAQQDLRHKTEVRLNDHVSYCKGTAQVIVLAETNDNYLTIFVELDRDINRLPPEEIAYWHKFLGLIEQEWRENKIAFTRTMDPFSTQIQALMPTASSEQYASPSDVTTSN